MDDLQQFLYSGLEGLKKPLELNLKEPVNTTRKCRALEKAALGTPKISEWALVNLSKSDGPGEEIAVSEAFYAPQLNDGCKINEYFGLMNKIQLLITYVPKKCAEHVSVEPPSVVSEPTSKKTVTKKTWT